MAGGITCAYRRNHSKNRCENQYEGNHCQSITTVSASNISLKLAIVLLHFQAPQSGPRRFRLPTSEPLDSEHPP